VGQESEKVFHLHLCPPLPINEDNTGKDDYRHDELQQNSSTPEYRCGDFEATEAHEFSVRGEAAATLATTQYYNKIK
jgi:hypothetical protein